MTSVFNPLTFSESARSLPTKGIDLDRMVATGNTNYFKEALSFVIENQKEFNEANRVFYKSIVESGGSEEAIHESFGDFFGKIKEIIDKFLRFVKSLFDRFVTNLNAFISSEKYLKKHKDDFPKFTSDNEFRYTGYVFTFSPDIPVVDAGASFDDSFVYNKDGWGSANTPVFPNKDQFKTYYDDLQKTLDSSDWYDRFRASVLGRDDAIYQDSFADELFCEYRNGESSPEEIDITPTEVMRAYSRFDGGKKAIDTANSTKSKIEKSYNNVKKQIDKAMTINYNGSNKTASIDGQKTTLTGDDITNADKYMKAKSNQVQEMCNIHVLAFSAKLDALNDCFRQDKSVLYKALSKIQGNLKGDL